MLPEIELLDTSLHTTSSQCTSQHLIINTMHSPCTQARPYSVLSRGSEEMELGMLPEIEVLNTKLHTTSS